LLALAAGSFGCLPPDPAPKAPPTDPDTAALVHAWRVDAHLLAKSSSLSDADAAGLHGPAVPTRPTRHNTPRPGHPRGARRGVRRERPLAEVAAELAIDGPRLQQLGLADPLVEYRLSCLDPQSRTPALTVYVANAHALTCSGGACYVLVY